MGGIRIADTVATAVTAAFVVSAAATDGNAGLLTGLVGATGFRPRIAAFVTTPIDLAHTAELALSKAISIAAPVDPATGFSAGAACPLTNLAIPGAAEFLLIACPVTAFAITATLAGRATLLATDTRSNITAAIPRRRAQIRTRATNRSAAVSLRTATLAPAVNSPGLAAHAVFARSGAAASIAAGLVRRATRSVAFLDSARAEIGWGRRWDGRPGPRSSRIDFCRCGHAGG